MPLADKLLFLLVNVLVYVRHPSLVWHTYRHLRRWPDIAAPRKNSDFIQWRKVFDRNPVFPVLADKLTAKAWIAERVPDLAIPETVWVYQSALRRHLDRLAERYPPRPIADSL